MSLSWAWPLLGESPEFERGAAALQQAPAAVWVEGLAGTAKWFVAAGLAGRVGGPPLVITAGGGAREVAGDDPAGGGFRRGGGGTCPPGGYRWGRTGPWGEGASFFRSAGAEGGRADASGGAGSALARRAARGGGAGARGDAGDARFAGGEPPDDPH